MFRSLLIANRGEIACRIIATARKLGVETIAIYSEADRDARHVRLADEAWPIGPAPVGASYLNREIILDVARRSGAEAIHPGYGFWAENADFAEACRAEGLIWIGPHVAAIAQMGSKIAAKDLAVSAGVPVVPGYAGDDQSVDRLCAEGRGIGFPLMIKASAGGGGKGMRTVWHADALLPALQAARLEAERAFGDGALLLEKLVERPRHIEVQIIADQHGTVLHAFDRDCSVQRHHQKVVEEAPAADLDASVRLALQDYACRLAASIGYDSLGTVEFMLDTATGAVYFLEMNTRLQVEHTVTEAITGLDLVALQMQAAAGLPLALGQEDIRAKGHAIEVRIAAERPELGFEAATGQIKLWQLPETVRVDSGVEMGQVISPHYDSLLAKFIAHGDNRPDALHQMGVALARFSCSGVQTNRCFLADILANDAFRRGGVATDFLDMAWPDGWQAKGDTCALYAVLATHLDCIARQKSSPHIWGQLGGFRLLGAAGDPARTLYRVVQDGHVADWLLVEEGAVFHLSHDDQHLTCAARLVGDHLLVTLHGRTERMTVSLADGQVWLSHRTWDGVVSVAPQIDQLSAGAAMGDDDAGAVRAPMPGLLVDLRVGAGDAVAAGDVVAVLESMKLLTDLCAPADGIIADLHVMEGVVLDRGALIATLAI